MPAGIIMRGIFSGSRLLPHTNGDRLCVDPRFLCPAAAPQALGDIISGFARCVRKFLLSLEAKSVRIMDLKYVRSELRKLSEIVEGWNANQEIGSLERDLVLDKLRTLYEAVRFDAEAEPPAADASEQEPFPTEIPVSLDLGEVLSIEPLPIRAGTRIRVHCAPGGVRGRFPRLRYRGGGNGGRIRAGFRAGGRTRAGRGCCGTCRNPG